MLIKIDDYDETVKFVHVMLNLDRGHFSCFKKFGKDVYFISESSYETCLVNGVKMDVLKNE